MKWRQPYCGVHDRMGQPKDALRSESGGQWACSEQMRAGARRGCGLKLRRLRPNFLLPAIYQLTWLCQERATVGMDNGFRRAQDFRSREPFFQAFGNPRICKSCEMIGNQRGKTGCHLQLGSAAAAYGSAAIIVARRHILVFLCPSCLAS